jgi:hypothetical protein
MTESQKRESIRTILDLDISEEARIGVYLTLAKAEIISWVFGYTDKDINACELPTQYDTLQINAVIAGYSINGAENQTSHNENGISRSFKHSDMSDYIRSNATPFVGVM